MYVGAAIALMVYGNFELSLGWRGAAASSGIVVSDVEAGGPADGKLHPGDVVVGVSQNVIPPVGYFRHSAPTAASYSVRLAPPRLATIELAAPIVRTNRRNGWIAILVPGVVFGVVGLWLAFVRPDVPVARLFAVAFVGVGFLQLESSLDAIANQLPRSAQLLYGTFALWVGLTNALIYHAATRLPGPVPPRWAWPRLGIAVYAVGVAAFVTYGLTQTILWWSDADRAAWLLLRWAPWFAFGGPLRTFAELLGIIATLVVLGWKFAHVRQPDERRRLRWLFVGCIAATLPFSFYKIVQLVTIVVVGDPAALSDSPLRVVSNAGITIAPIAIAYAIAKHQILDISVVVRRGLRYLLAKHALQFVLLIPVGALAYSVVANRDRTIKDTLLLNPAALGLMVGALLTLRFRSPLRQKLDQLFFREAYDRERVLLALIEKVDRLDSMVDVVRLVVQELNKGLHPGQLSVWFRVGQTREFSLTHSSSGMVFGPIPIAPSLVKEFETRRTHVRGGARMMTNGSKRPTSSWSCRFLARTCASAVCCCWARKSQRSRTALLTASCSKRSPNNWRSLEKTFG
jgi:hypothetical protein